MDEYQSPVVPECPVTFCMSKIGGKSKPVILFLVQIGFTRYDDIASRIEGISQRKLKKHLKELEASRVLECRPSSGTEPILEYRLTEFGRSFLPIIQSMKDWGEKYRSMQVRENRD